MAWYDLAVFSNYFKQIPQEHSSCISWRHPFDNFFKETRLSYENTQQITNRKPLRSSQLPQPPPKSLPKTRAHPGILAGIGHQEPAAQWLRITFLHTSPSFWQRAWRAAKFSCFCIRFDESEIQGMVWLGLDESSSGYDWDGRRKNRREMRVEDGYIALASCRENTNSL